MKNQKIVVTFTFGWLIGLIIIGLLATQRTSLASTIYRNLGLMRLVATATLPTESSDDSSNWFERGQNMFPEDHRMWYALTLSYRSQGKIEEARPTLDRYLDVVPGDMAGRFILSDMAYESGDVTHALQNWSAYANEIVIIQKAADELERGNLDEAQQLLEIALGGDITSYSIAFRLAGQYALLVASLQQLGDASRLNSACDSGSIAYGAAIEAEPLLGFVRINHGSFLRRCQRYQEAIAQFLSVDDSMQKTTRAWASHEIALTYRLLNQDDNAVVYFERATELDPQNGQYRLLLGQTYARLSRTDEARAQFSEIVSEADLEWKALAEAELARLR